MTAYATKADMEDVLKRVFALQETDAAFRQAAKKVRLSLSWEIDDLDIVYIITFDKGAVTTQLPANPKEAEVHIRMSSDTYDRMFKGKLSPVRANLFGQMKVTGNVLGARALEGLLPSMIHIYKQAKAAYIREHMADETEEAAEE